MANVDWQNGVSDRKRRSILDIYKPRALRLNPVDGDNEPYDDNEPYRQANGNCPPDGDPHETDAPTVDLRKLEEELGRRRLDEIADVVRALTYGEMMELAASMWNVKPDGSNLTEHNLPAVLYRWSTSRQS
jgi:hypothetical protein